MASTVVAYSYPGVITCAGCGYAIHFDDLDGTPGASARGRCKNYQCERKGIEIEVKPTMVHA